MSYSTIDKPTDFFNTKLYTGNASTQSITGVGFQPDLNWTKGRNVGTFHMLTDAVRGATKVIQSNTTTAEQTFASGLTSFDSDGFTAGNSDDINGNYNYASWNWKANGAGSANTDGSISSTVSANSVSGFSIVKFTANGSNNGTIGHGLSSTPAIVIYKRLDGTGSWYVLYTFVDGSQDYLILDSSSAKADLASATYGTATSSTISNIGFTNNHSMLAYCFADVKGYSKFGSYTGNGNGNNASNADGTFVYTGFKPAFFLVKSTGSFNWLMYDDKRDTINPNTSTFLADDGGAEYNTGRDVDFLSNGFKMRANYNGNNASGVSFIYMVFAENPFVGSNFVPNNAK